MNEKNLSQDEIKHFLERSHRSYEVERKFILNSIPSIFLTDAKKSEIIQYYILNEAHDANHLSMLRVRKIIEDDKITYIQTIKNPIGSDFAVSETETELTEEEFNFLLEKSDSKISKKRYTLYIDNNKWEVDEFHELNIIMAELEKLGDNWDNAVSLEKEIMSIELPNSIKEVLKEEVTGQVEWSNKTLSLKVKEMFGK